LIRTICGCVKDLWEFAYKLKSAFPTAEAIFWVSPLKRAKAVRALGEPALKGGPMRLAFGEVQTRSPLKRAVDRVNGIAVCMQNPSPVIRVDSIKWTLPL